MTLRVGLFGAGVVGGGVVELLDKASRSGRLGALGARVELVRICVKSVHKPRDFSVDPKLLTARAKDILDDESINCVVELIGGVTDAKDVVLSAIRAGKHVITANKALVALYLGEIQEALALNPSVRFAYEAAVCGGIPIIRTLQTDFTADTITKVMGIMNGTTNFMLCKMEDEGADYHVALAEAQALGFAEADPTADVEGLDVQAKIALLAKLSFGKTVPVGSIPTTGISKLTKMDFEYAQLMRSTIKLVGTACLNDDGSLAVYVSPTIVPLQHALSSAKGAGNMVMVNSHNLPASSFAGPGAGRYPTANSVLSDVLRLALGQHAPPFPLQQEDVEINNNFSARFYVRIGCSNGLGIIRAVGEAAEQQGVSIHSILQVPTDDRTHRMDFVVTTEKVTLAKVRAFAADVQAMSFTHTEPLFMPML